MKPERFASASIFVTAIYWEKFRNNYWNNKYDQLNLTLFCSNSVIITITSPLQVLHCDLRLALLPPDRPTQLSHPYLPFFSTIWHSGSTTTRMLRSGRLFSALFNSSKHSWLKRGILDERTDTASKWQCSQDQWTVWDSSLSFP
jgi:hypothetical protein